MITLNKALETPGIVDWLLKAAAGIAFKRNWFIDSEDAASEAMAAMLRRNAAAALTFENINQFKGYAVKAILKKGATLLEKEHAQPSIHTSTLEEGGFDVEDIDKRSNPVIDEQLSILASVLPRLTREKERVVIEESLKGAKAAAIRAQFPDLFPSVNSVYVAKNQATQSIRALIGL